MNRPKSGRFSKRPYLRNHVDHTFETASPVGPYYKEMGAFWWDGHLALHFLASVPGSCLGFYAA